jgi:ribosomal protein S20
MLIAGTACMAIPNLPNWIGIIVCLLVLAITAIAVLSAGFAASVVTEIDQRVKVKTFFIKSLTVDAEHLMNTSKTTELKALAKKVYEAVRYSDPMSNAVLVEVEESRTRKVADAGVVSHNEKLAVDLITLGAVGVPPRIGEINSEIVEIIKVSARCESRELVTLIKHNVKIHRSRGNTISDTRINAVRNKLLDLDAILLFCKSVSCINRRAHNVSRLLGAYIKGGIRRSRRAAGDNDE